MIIGIDFGTCFSCIAYMNSFRAQSLIADEDRLGIPTIFMYSKRSDKELYGYECSSRLR